MWSDDDKAESRNAESRNGVKRRPRKSFKLLLFLLAGAIINVAVAWGCVFIVLDHSGKLGVTTSGAMNKFKWSYFGASGEVLLRLVNEDVTNPQSLGPLKETNDEFVRRISTTYGPGPSRLEWQCKDRRGFPIPNMCSEQLATRRGSPNTRTIRIIDGWDAGLIGEKHLGMVMQKPFPLRPIFPEFAINTIFYAAIAWGLFAVPGMIRRRVRRKRGQCAACGYSRRGTPDTVKCPECGATA